MEVIISLQAVYMKQGTYQLSLVQFYGLPTAL